MKKPHRVPAAPLGRSGVILLIVISLLVLFSLVGLAFVVYAEGQANIARLWREGETEQRPDMDPELLLSYFLGQLIYDTDNTHSALRGLSLARNMYGRLGSTSAFSGTGRIHTDPDQALDDYYQFDYTQYGVGARNPDQYGSPNPSYTYPDFNHPFLAAQEASDGKILIPSYVRYRLDGALVSLRPDRTYHGNFPAWADASGDVRNYADGPGFLGVPPVPVVGGAPNDSIWIDCGFPVMTSADGRRYKPLFAPLILDLDNRVNVNVHGNNMESILDFNNTDLAVPYQQGTYSWGEHNSTQGFGYWEVNLQRVIDKKGLLIPSPPGTNPAQGDRNAFEARKIFCGTPAFNGAGTRSVRGRYDPNFWDSFITGQNNPIQNSAWPGLYSRTGPFYAQTEFECEWVGFPPSDVAPVLPPPPPGAASVEPGFGIEQIHQHWSTFYFWIHPGWYANGAYGPECGYHAIMYNFFFPELSCMGMQNWRREDRIFSVANLEALLRYGDNGSPSSTSDLFALCPKSFGDAVTGGRARRLVTTHAFDRDVPGAIPFFHWPVGGGSPMTLSALGVPERGPVVFPPAGALPANGDFNLQWQNVTTALGRININRELPNYPGTVLAVAGDPATDTFRIAPADYAPGGGFLVAQQARQDLAKELYELLLAVTGVRKPPGPAGPQRIMQRWLAQLAVNIVDFRDNDDYITPFEWVGTGVGTLGEGVVFGCELPRLVVNEAYSEIVNTNPADANAGYDVKFWLEFLNPLCRDGYLKEGGNARLQVPVGPAAEPAYAAYRVMCMEASAANTILFERKTNPLLYGGGAILAPPGQIKLLVQDWVADGPPATQPKAGVDVNIVRPIDYYCPGVGTAARGFPFLQDASDLNSNFNGDNRGYYVVGPGMLNGSDSHFPGTDPAAQTPVGTWPIATLRIKDQTVTAAEGVAGWRSSMVYHTSAANLTAGGYSMPAALPKHAFVLQRLACPHMPPNVPSAWATHDPARPINPYVTVDWVDEVPTNDAAVFNTFGAVNPPAAMSLRYSYGRSQAYAAHKAHWAKQVLNPPWVRPVPAPGTLTFTPVENLFFSWNVIESLVAGANQPLPGPTPANPYRVLYQADRHLISAMELLHVGCHPPHMQTQKFLTKDAVRAPAAPNLVPFDHEAPWYDQDIPIDLAGTGVKNTSHMLYPFFEYVQAQCIHQGAPLGSRAIGRVNINTVFDKEVFLAVMDPRYHNYYQVDQIDSAVAPVGMWQRLLQVRKRNNPPGNPCFHFNEIDRPFLGMATPFTGGAILGGTDPQYPRGVGLHETFFRCNWNDQNTLLFDIDPTRRVPDVANIPGLSGIGGDGLGGVNNPEHPFWRHEALRKSWNNWTTRSNVFAVYLTVGYFEVVGDGVSGGPPLLGQELNRRQNRHVRHRMLAIIDRTNVTMPFDPATGPVVGQQGPRPWYCHTEGTTIADPVTAQTLRLSIQPAQTNRYEDVSFNMSKDPVTGVVSIIVNGVNIGNRLVIDSGPSRETITVTDVDGPGQTITAIFTKAHPCWGVPVTNVGVNTIFGNPGPQPRFDFRHPDYAGVVRFTSIWNRDQR